MSIHVNVLSRAALGVVAAGALALSAAARRIPSRSA